ncbi:hypothetical protein MRB53_011898 [Persea americana]|uniref:Uncharacterized protein n=1 Tax=Persea americana TaxID=3435 RepID=A0ACC2LVT3_PERAE|nr:hypothetical protein MRB53_011898 [Persea americana]
MLRLLVAHQQPSAHMVVETNDQHLEDAEDGDFSGEEAQGGEEERSVAVGAWEGRALYAAEADRIRNWAESRARFSFTDAMEMYTENTWVSVFSLPVVCAFIILSSSANSFPGRRSPRDQVFRSIATAAREANRTPQVAVHCRTLDSCSLSLEFARGRC